MLNPQHFFLATSFDQCDSHSSLPEHALQEVTIQNAPLPFVHCYH